MSSERSIAFVATGQIPPSEPPASEVGPIHWLRQNLFDGVVNTLLTVASVVAIVMIIPPLFDWIFLKGVWNADSLGGCREVIAAAHGEGVVGGCWAVINERFNQFMFGFYPSELYWRPLLAFVLMFVALAPALFSNLPRKMLFFSALYPLVAYYLIWGGSILWVAILFAGLIPALLVFMIAMFLLDQLSVDRRAAPNIAFVAGLGATAPYWCVVLLAVLGVNLGLPTGLSELSGWHLEPVESAQIGGFLLAITIGVTGIVASLPIGIVLALGRQSSMFFIKTICVVFIEFIRGVPLITLLFVASVLLNYFLPPGTSFDLILRVVIMVTLFAYAYMAEVIRGGLAALPSGQYEAADALGLNYWKSTRLIIMPQALKVSIPGIVNSFIGLFKDTTLVSVIGLLDPVGLLNPIRASPEWNGVLWELYVFVAVFFWIFCFSMSRYSMYLEKKLKTDR
jgi:general L-amino acid transport system permease protein